MKMSLNTTTMLKNQRIFVARKESFSETFQTQLTIIVVLITAIIVILQQATF